MWQSRKLFKQGNSTVLAIPSDYLEHLDAEPGDYIQLRKHSGGKITLRQSPASRAQRGLRKALKIKPH